MCGGGRSTGTGPSRTSATGPGRWRAGGRGVCRGRPSPFRRYRGWELAGRVAGLVGLGAVARALRWRLRGLGMEVIAYDPYTEEPTVTLDELLSRPDVVSLHAPVTPETTGMIGAGQFAAMRDGVVFLNSARAALHDTDALVAALETGKVSAAGF